MKQLELKKTSSLLGLKLNDPYLATDPLKNL